MGLLNYFVYDGVNSSDYGVFISGEGTFNSPKRRGEVIEIPGRNGSLFMDEDCFENIPGKYPAFIGTKSEEDFRDKLAAFKSAILSRGNYKRLSDTYHPDEFRLATYKSGLEVDPKHYNRAGGFTLEFDCKPQRFLLTGETVQTFNASGSITNPELFASAPLLEIDGTGTLTIGDYSLEIDSSPGTIFIDAEIMEAYSISGGDLVSENGNVIYANHKPPKIDPGTIAVTLGAGITSVKITPRWWRL